MAPVPPSTEWTQVVLYTFTGVADGGEPIAGPVFDKAGNLYGNTIYGGLYGIGTVFELSPPAAGGDGWTESVLHSFRGGEEDGAKPEAGMVFDRTGNLYGTTFNSNGPSYCCGTVFRLTPPATPGEAWTETILHHFPYSLRYSIPILVGGDLYGTAPMGGDRAAGVVWRLDHPAAPGGVWRYSVVYDFRGGADGGMPMGSLTFHDNVLFGTTNLGGQHSQGTVFRLVPPAVAGGAWTKNILYSFVGGGDAYPAAPVIFDKAGSLYGTTSGGFGPGECGGACGSVFQLTPPASEGASWTDTKLYIFEEGGIFAVTSGVIFDDKGTLFGFALTGGNTNGGGVFGITR
jgi:uncharacterized repeat protein (TIGR03803 family)